MHSCGDFTRSCASLSHADDNRFDGVFVCLLRTTLPARVNFSFSHPPAHTFEISTSSPKTSSNNAPTHEIPTTPPRALNPRSNNAHTPEKPKPLQQKIQFVKRKRLKVEMVCNCNSTRACNFLYCICRKAGRRCGPSCRCRKKCCNTNDTFPAPIPNGCTCKRTRCLKLYCVCLSAGRQCGARCKCMNCQNNEPI